MFKVLTLTDFWSENFFRRTSYIIIPGQCINFQPSRVTLPRHTLQGEKLIPVNL
jgi:hypothetical protein